ncbi:hypothetical protein San01_23770 [Streptomyces angustmyceticus]|uniref:Uncharacterized protein n=1 Tax=Streptomyces angustmyceticus TaxID=285578 RepID=A0A5J4LEF9_9ACTN|nr:hypothetical protein San01_23770 [Streptomyces angustmyceticus]
MGPNLTMVAPVKPEPVRVTWVPPAGTPWAGLILVTTGAMLLFSFSYRLGSRALADGCRPGRGVSPAERAKRCGRTATWVVPVGPRPSATVR